MFTIVFVILAIWFVANVSLMWFTTGDKKLEKTFGWINVAAIIIGFGVYFTATKVNGIENWFNAMNYLNILVALAQLYFGYGNNHFIRHA